MSFEKKVSTRALYLQVRDYLAQQIASGILKPGSLLPAELAFAEELGVSLGTLRKGLETLEKERLITRRQGRGTFVRDYAAAGQPTFDNLRTKDGEHVPFTVQFLDAVCDRASAEEQERLGLETPEIVVRCRQVRHYHSPFLFEQIALAVSRFAGLDGGQLTASYQIAVLAQEHGVLLGVASESIDIMPASAEVAALLHVEPGTPLLKLDRVHYSLDRIPLEWRIGYCQLASVKYVSRLKS